MKEIMLQCKIKKNFKKTLQEEYFMFSDPLSFSNTI